MTPGAASCYIGRKDYLMRKTKSVCVAVLIFMITCGGTSVAQTSPTTVTAAVKSNYINDETKTTTTLYLVDEVKALYTGNNEFLFWFDVNTLSATKIKGLLDLMSELKSHGFVADYHVEAIKAAVDKIRADSTDAEKYVLDILATDAYLKICRDVLWGQVDPKKIHGADWNYQTERAQYTAFARESLINGTIEKSVMTALPQLESYLGLTIALKDIQKYIDKDGWPKVLKGGAKKWELGEKGAHIKSLKERLRVTGELKSQNSADEELYDDELLAAVKKFQETRGLNVDGAVGIFTQELLNLSAEDIKKQIIINLERLRWLPREFEREYIFANIPDFRMRLIQGDREILNMKTVVGNTRWHTPVFKDEMEYVVINPQWHVPERILSKEMFPKIVKDSSYIQRGNFRVTQSVDGKIQEIDPSDVDWSTASVHDYHFSQRSGAENDLGRFKFLFPNRFSVYMHDTSSKGLFANDIRAYSHGCVRLSKPWDLAELLLGHYIEKPLTHDEIQKRVDTGKEQMITLKTKIPVYIYYLTAWADAKGSLSLRKDVYDYDKKMAKVLGL